MIWKADNFEGESFCLSRVQHSFRERSSFSPTPQILQWWPQEWKRDGVINLQFRVHLIIPWASNFNVFFFLPTLWHHLIVFCFPNWPGAKWMAQNWSIWVLAYRVLRTTEKEVFSCLPAGAALPQDLCVEENVSPKEANPKSWELRIIDL